MEKQVQFYYHPCSYGFSMFAETLITMKPDFSPTETQNTHLIITDLVEGHIDSGMDKLRALKDEIYASILARQRQSRGIAHGDKARLFNAQGVARLVVHLTEDLTPGVICLLEGVWVALDEHGVDRAGSANIFTSLEGTCPGKATIMHAVGVEVVLDTT